MDLSAYADALGIKQSRGDPPPGSGIVTPEQQRPDSRFADGSASGPGGSVAALKATLADKRIPPDARADLQAELARMQPQGSDLSPYAAALGITNTPVQAAQPAQPASPTAGTNAGIPDAVAPSGPGNVEPTWWQKAKGVASAASSMTTGAVGGLATGAANIATLPGDLIAGRPHEPLESAVQRGQQALTYTPADQGSQDVASSILQNKIVQSLPAMAAVAPTMAPQIRPGSMQAMQDSFAAKARPRIEPTMGEAAPVSAPVATSAPTLAQASPALQKVVADAKAKGVPINPGVVAKHVEAETLPVPGKLTQGQALGDPVMISEEMNGRGKGSQAPVSPEFYKEQGQVVAKNMEAIRSSAAPDVPLTASAVDHGQALIDAYKRMDEPIRAEITNKYKALADANGGDLPLSGQAFVSAADTALKKANRTRFVPNEVQGILGDLREGGPMTFNDFETYRTILAEQARKADRAGDGTASYAVGLVRDALESLPMEGEAANLKPLADAARQAAKARFDAIKSDPAYKASIGDSASVGEPSPLADKFFPSYVTKGARSNVALMREHLASDPLAAQTIAAGTIDQLAAQMKADPQTGNFQSAAYLKNLDALRPKLGLLLDETAAQQAQAVGNFAKSAQARPRGSYVNSSNTATALVAEGAKAAATHGTNMLFGGLPVGSGARMLGGKILDARESRNASKNALAPGAGITRLSDLPR